MAARSASDSESTDPTRGELTGVAALRRLKVIGIVLPVAFIVVVELVRLVIIEQTQPSLGHGILGLVSVLAVVGFGMAMFFFIDRAYRLVLRQNRELAAVNAVSAAVRGDLGVDQIIDAALRSVLVSTGATEASVTASVPAGRLLNEDVATWRRVATASPARAGHGSRPARSSRAVDIALLAGTTGVGSMRLYLPGDQGDGASDTLQNIGQQVGSAIKHAQLIADLQRRMHEGHALYDGLLRISHQRSPVQTLAFMAELARDLLGADEALLCLNEATSRFIQTYGSVTGTPVASDGLVCVRAESAEVPHAHRESGQIRSSTEFPETVSVPLRGPDGLLGHFWLGRRTGGPFGGRDSSFLETLAELAVIAIANARMLENECQGAILAERERIAREMHDSLAQVLGATHLRLRGLSARPEVRAAAEVERELSDLAGVCHEAYRDVREAILGLHESSRPDRALLESLHAYVDKFSRQSGIQTVLESTLDHDLTLTPGCEVQIIRVIQEALTNVRKHSGARCATVRITETAAATTFVVEDDGHGFESTPAQSTRDGFGLHSMRERMKLVGGGLAIDSAPGRGTRIIASVPGRTGLLTGRYPLVPERHLAAPYSERPSYSDGPPYSSGPPFSSGSTPGHPLSFEAVEA